MTGPWDASSGTPGQWHREARERVEDFLAHASQPGRSGFAAVKSIVAQAAEPFSPLMLKAEKEKPPPKNPSAWLPHCQGTPTPKPVTQGQNPSLLSPALSSIALWSIAQNLSRGGKESPIHQSTPCTKTCLWKTLRQAGSNGAFKRKANHRSEYLGDPELLRSLAPLCLLVSGAHATGGWLDFNGSRAPRAGLGRGGLLSHGRGPSPAAMPHHLFSLFSTEDARPEALSFSP